MTVIEERPTSAWKTRLEAEVAVWRRPARPRPLAGFAVGALMTLVGLMGWVMLYAGPLSGLQHSHSQAELYATFRHELVRETAPLGGVIRVGDPVAVLTSSRAGLHGEVVVEGTTSAELETGPGHLRTSVLPGQTGSAVVFGRSLTFGGPFAHITRLRPGDTITAVTQQGRFTYRVDGVRRVGDPVPAAIGPGKGRLVLVTSEGDGWRSGWAPSHQVFVDATLQGAAQPPPTGRVTAISAGERAMAGDTTRLPLVVVTLPLLVLVLSAGLWLHARGSRPRAWLLGVPVLVGALWLVSETSAQLMPNLI